MLYVFAKGLLVVSLILQISACADKAEPQALPTGGEMSTWTPEERAAKAPNKAFEAVYSRSPEDVESVLEENPEFFKEKNSLGVTPLMLAIERKEARIAVSIVTDLSISDLKDKSEDGRGYISFAAEHGLVEVIDVIADKYKSSLSYGLARFHNIDFKDNLGRTAIFYAANGNVAKTLEAHWTWWTVSRVMTATPLSGFFREYDVNDKSFLHTAAANDRYAVITWANQQICGEPWFNDSDFLWGGLRWVAKQGDFLVGAAQRSVWFSDLVNTQDDAGDSPLHVAARSGSVRSVQALLSCRFIHLRRANNFGRNPMAALLAALDRNQSKIDESFKKAFDLLLSQENYISLRRNFTKRMINDQDIDGRSAMHHAAKLRDSYFYLKLEEKGGDIYLESNDAETPLSMYKRVER